MFGNKEDQWFDGLVTLNLIYRGAKEDQCGGVDMERFGEVDRDPCQGLECACSSKHGQKARLVVCGEATGDEETQLMLVNVGVDSDGELVCHG